MALNPNISVRQQSILDYMRSHGEVQVESLAETFNVTPQTIRRDLNQLYQLRLLQRVHGGAVIQDGIKNLGYGARKNLGVVQKAAIGRAAAQLIPNDSSLFINIGTTTEQVAEHIANHIGLLVVTNNMNVAYTLRTKSTFEIMIAGGLIRREDGGIIGGSTEEFVSKFKVDYAVIGASAIDEDGDVLDFDAREVRVAQAIVAHARSVILVADSMKFQRTAPIRICDISQVDCLVTDQQPPLKLQEICRAGRVDIEVASGVDEKND